jgi:hypothetical protein
MTAKMNVNATDQSRYQSSGVMVVPSRFGAQKTYDINDSYRLIGTPAVADAVQETHLAYKTCRGKNEWHQEFPAVV